jgi:hypothetical protein
LNIHQSHGSFLKLFVRICATSRTLSDRPRITDLDRLCPTTSSRLLTPAPTRLLSEHMPDRIGVAASSAPSGRLHCSSPRSAVCLNKEARTLLATHLHVPVGHWHAHIPPPGSGASSGGGPLARQRATRTARDGRHLLRSRSSGRPPSRRRFTHHHRPGARRGDGRGSARGRGPPSRGVATAHRAPRSEPARSRCRRSSVSVATLRRARRGKRRPSASSRRSRRGALAHVLRQELGVGVGCGDMCVRWPSPPSRSAGGRHDPLVDLALVDLADARPGRRVGRARWATVSEVRSDVCAGCSSARSCSARAGI